MTVARDLRKRSTESEKLLWSALRNRGLLGLKFRRQHTFGRFVVDFYCPELKLVIEVDGGIHDHSEQRERDAIRQEIIEMWEVRFIRIRADDVENRFEETLTHLEHQLRNLSPSPCNGEGAGG